MAIVRLEDKYKTRNEIELHPRRHFSSSSSGITGSLYVFPNRSETQKDNIDERLNLAGTLDGEEIRPYDSNSLEQRRIEIYEGNFSKLTVSPFTDATQFEYEYLDTVDSSNDGTYTGEELNDHIFDSSTIIPTVQNPIVVTATQKVTNTIFEWSSAGYWRKRDSTDIFRRLPESDRDLTAKNYEVPLAILLDGANAFTEDHAWRAIAKKNGELADLYELYQNDPTNPDYASYASYQSYYDEGWRSGNSSFTNTATPEKYQFSGLSVVYDETGTPYQGAPVNSKKAVNPWPPEIAKWDIPINSNWVMQGYSDLSMHPRNKTQKNLQLLRGNEDYFSRSMLAQRQLFNRIRYMEVENPGWWVRNYQCMSLSQYEDTSGNTKVPCLAYRNDNNDYQIQWDNEDSVTFEFWIKPTREQTSPGTICHLPDNYAIVLLPHDNSLANGVYSKFKIGMYVQGAAASTETPSTNDVTTSGASNAGIYVTGALCDLDTWHHVAIRWSENFNNGLLSVYIDGKLETSITEDGVYSGSRTGLVNTNYTSSAQNTFTIGGWQSDSFNDIWGGYAEHQNLRISSVFRTFDQGYSIDATYQLKSELTEFRMWSIARTIFEINETKNVGLSSKDNLKCYIPFTFDPDTDTPQFKRKAWIPETNAKNRKEYYSKSQSVSIGGTTNLVEYSKVPFCTNNAYIAGAPITMVHSFLCDKARNKYPVITGMPELDNVANLTGDADYIAEYGLLKNFAKEWKNYKWLRNLNSIILPCDNGSFVPDFEINNKNYNYQFYPYRIKLSGSEIGDINSKYEIQHFLDDEVFSISDVKSSIDPSFANLGEDGIQTALNEINTVSLSDSGKLTDADFISPLGILINIPQLYYGNRIQHKSINLTFRVNDEGKIITIKDFEGCLYRFDSQTSKKISKVGHVDYMNGIICVFSPLLTSIGIDDFDIKFSGTKNMHVLQLDIPCEAGIANVSTNKNYKNLKASANANETDGLVTYISTIYLHDSNLNIVGKVNLARPIIKREEDSFIFRVKVDF